MFDGHLVGQGVGWDWSWVAPSFSGPDALFACGTRESFREIRREGARRVSQAQGREIWIQSVVFCWLILLFVSVQPLHGSSWDLGREPGIKEAVLYQDHPINITRRSGRHLAADHSTAHLRATEPSPTTSVRSMAQGFVTHSGDGLATASECLVELMVVLLEGTVTQLSRTRGWGSGFEKRKRKLIAGVLCVWQDLFSSIWETPSEISRKACYWLESSCRRSTRQESIKFQLIISWYNLENTKCMEFFFGASPLTSSSFFTPGEFSVETRNWKTFLQRHVTAFGESQEFPAVQSCKPQLPSWLCILLWI